MANITEDVHFTSKLNQVLSSSETGILAFFSALNIFLSITASLGNAMILISLHKVSSIHPPTKLLIRCLAVTDLCVGVIVQPLYVICLMAPLSPPITTISASHYTSVFLVFNTLSWVSCSVSEMTSTAIAVDRILALLLGLRYRHVVTSWRVRVVIICFWLIASSLGIMWRWRSDIIFLGAILVTLSLVISTFCYTRIYLKLRHQQAQVQNHVPLGRPNGSGGIIPLNIARFKKSVSSILWVQLALTACYVPWIISAALAVNGKENDVAWIAVLTLVLLNSSLNPILYCWKITHVKQAVRDSIRQLKCFSFFN